MSKPFEGGAYAYQRLNFETKGQAHEQNAEASNYLGNPAVRHYRGASGNVTLVEL